MTGNILLGLWAASHALFGIVLALAALLLGLALASSVGRTAGGEPGWSVGIIFVFGISALGAAAYVSLFGLLPAGIAAGFVAAGCVRGALVARRNVTLVSPMIRGALRSLPYGLLATLIAAIYYHGPMPGVNGSPFGDEVFYAGRVDVLAELPWRTNDLQAEGFVDEYFWSKNLPMVLASAFVKTGMIDSFLFLSVSGPLFCILWLAAVLGTEAEREKPDTVTVLLTAACLSVSTLSFWWLIESPPVTIILPLVAIGLVAFRSPGVSPRDWLIVGILTAALCLESKPPALVFFAPLLGLITLAKIATTYGRSWAIAAAIGGLAVAASVGATILLLSPGYVRVHNIGLASLFGIFGGLPFESASDVYEKVVPASSGGASSWEWGAVETALWVASRIAFLTAFGTILSWRRPAGVLRPAAVVATGAAVIATLTIPSSAYIAFRCVTVLVGLTAAYMRPARSWFMAFAAASVAVLMLTTVTRPFTLAVETTVLLAIFFGGMVAAQMPVYTDGSIAAKIGRLAKLTSAGSWVALAMLFVALVATPWGVGRVRRPMDLTAANYDIWHAARRYVPPNGLIFTDQTGLVFDLTHAWNYYAVFGLRQVFISGWYEIAGLEFDEEKLRERLAANERVLTGDMAPYCATLSRPYSTYFALVSITRAMPSRWQEVYRNEEYSLRRFMPEQGDARC